MEELRPNPDAILRAIKKNDVQSHQGKLRIFIGMSAGVGKTYAMLSMAHEKMAQGLDVIVGIVETHGRIETMKMLEGLPIIPRKKMDYAGTIIEEMDLESILERKPKIVLVDELAHTNPSGSRHHKRWQDVLEILENGIDVYSTINIQHIESKKDDIENITSISIFETVPDSIIERADHLEVIDLPPEDLLFRMKQGNVYKLDKAEQATQNFFQEDKLAALRQVLLRYSADKIDFQLENFKDATGRNKSWKTKEKILLAIGPGSEKEKLVRAAKQISDSLRCQWIALYVDTGELVGQIEQKKINKNLDLARELGAKVITTSDPDIIHAIERTCIQFNITQIVLGKSDSNPILNFLRGGSHFDKLNRLQNNVSIHLIRPNKKKETDYFSPLQDFKYAPYFLATIYSILLGLINSYLFFELELMPYKSIGFIFLLGVSIAGLIFQLGPTIYSSILCLGIWNFFFIPPIFTFHIESTDDVAMAISFFVVATITGALNSMSKKNQKLLREQEKRTKTLYQLSLEIINSQNKEECIQNISQSLSTFFNSSISISLKNSSGVLEHFKRGKDWIFNHPKEWSVSQYAFDKRIPTGRWTDTLPDAQSMFVPLVTKTECVGVLGFYPEDKNKILSVSEREILFTLCSQLAIYLERENYHESMLKYEKEGDI